MKNIISVEPINIIIVFVAIIGAVLMIFGKGDYGLILFIIATLIEAMGRVLR